MLSYRVDNNMNKQPSAQRGKKPSFWSEVTLNVSLSHVSFLKELLCGNWHLGVGEKKITCHEMVAKT